MHKIMMIDADTEEYKAFQGSIEKLIIFKDIEEVPEGDILR